MTKVRTTISSARQNRRPALRHSTAKSQL